MIISFQKGDIMGSVKEYINLYINLLTDEEEALKVIVKKTKKGERILKKDVERLNKIRRKKERLNKKCLKEKILTISMDNLIKALSKVTNYSEEKIKLNVETEVEVLGSKKKSMKQILKMLSEENKYYICFNISGEIFELPYEVKFAQKLDIFSKLSNKVKLIDYLYLTKTDFLVDGEMKVVTKLCIKEKAFKNIMHNFSLSQLFENDDIESLMLRKAVVNYAKNKEKENSKNF